VAPAGAGLLLTLLCLTPLGLLGLLALALAWAGWRGVWLMLEVRQPPGETPQRLRPLQLPHLQYHASSTTACRVPHC